LIRSIDRFSDAYILAFADPLFNCWVPDGRNRNVLLLLIQPDPAVEDFPFAVWSSLLARHSRNPRPSLLHYGDPMGYQPFREAVAAYLRTARSLRCDAGQIVGSAARTLLQGIQPDVEHGGDQLEQGVAFAVLLQPEGGEAFPNLRRRRHESVRSWTRVVPIRQLKGQLLPIQRRRRHESARLWMRVAPIRH
jgi:hypothetical protein